MPPGRCSLQPTTRRKPARNLGEKNNGHKRPKMLSAAISPEDFAQSIEVQVQSTCQQLLDGLHALGMPVVDGLNTLSERTSFNVLFLAGSHFWISLTRLKFKPLNAKELSSESSKLHLSLSQRHMFPQSCACFIFAQLRCNIGNAIGSARAAACPLWDVKLVILADVLTDFDYFILECTLMMLITSNNYII